MAYLLNIRTYETKGTAFKKVVGYGKTSIVEGKTDIPIDIKRVFYIYGSSLRTVRAGHRLKKTTQILICVRGSYKIYINDGKIEETSILNSPAKDLVVEPKDWHTMQALKAASILLVLSSEHYSVDEYIDEAYPTLS